jgi:DNA polymerase V
MQKIIYPPLFSASVSAGFSSPADDFLEQTVDLNKYLIRHPASNFFVRVRGVVIHAIRSFS